MHTCTHTQIHLARVNDCFAKLITHIQTFEYAPMYALVCACMCMCAH